MKGLLILIFSIFLGVSVYSQNQSYRTDIVMLDSISDLLNYRGGSKLASITDSIDGGLFYLYFGGLPVNNINIYAGNGSAKWRRTYADSRMVFDTVFIRNLMTVSGDTLVFGGSADRNTKLGGLLLYNFAVDSFRNIKLEKSDTISIAARQGSAAIHFYPNQLLINGSILPTQFSGNVDFLGPSVTLLLAPDNDSTSLGANTSWVQRWVKSQGYATGGTLTFSNGITQTGLAVKAGGTLNQNTTINNASSFYHEFTNGTNTYYRLFADGTHWWGNGSTVTSNGNRYQFYSGDIYVQQKISMGLASPSSAPLTIYGSDVTKIWMENSGSGAVHILMRNSVANLGRLVGTSDVYGIGNGAGSTAFVLTRAADKIIVGDMTSTNYSMEFKNTYTDGIRLPRGTTAQRPTNGDGTFRYNTENADLEFNTGSAWRRVFDDSKTLTIANGGIGLTTWATTHALVASGTTSSGVAQLISNATSGFILRSNGAGANPTFVDVNDILTADNYTAAITDETNVDATFVSAKYCRIGKMVEVTVVMDVDPTATGLVEVGIALPISSTLAAINDVMGVGTSDGSDKTAVVRGDATNDRARFFFTAAATGSQLWIAKFTYEIIIP